MVPLQSDYTNFGAFCSAGFAWLCSQRENSTIFHIFERFTSAVLGRFLISGIGTAVLFFALSYLFARGGMTPFFASVIAYAIAFGVGYTVQRSWTFQANTSHGRALPRYFILQAACALISGGVAEAAVRYLGATPFFMSVLTTLVAGGVSFVVSRVWVFRSVYQS